MKRRQFFRRLAAASLAFVAAPGVFRALPAAQNVRKAVGAPSVIPFWFQTTRRYRCVDAAYKEMMITVSISSNQPCDVHVGSPYEEIPETESYADFKARLDAARTSEKNFLAPGGRVG